MDLVTSLQKKVTTNEPLTPAREALLCQGLSQLSRDGANSAFILIKNYREHVDKGRQMGGSSCPYYGIMNENKTNPDSYDVEFDIEDLPLQLQLLLEVFLKEK